jgi:hypothetical protein
MTLICVLTDFFPHRILVLHSSPLRTITYREEPSFLAIKQTLRNMARKKPHLWDIHKADAKNSLTTLQDSASPL